MKKQEYFGIQGSKQSKPTRLTVTMEYAFVLSKYEKQLLSFMLQLWYYLQNSKRICRNISI